MKTARHWSLRLRLSLFFAALLIAAWTVAGLFSWLASREHINTFFDTQQMLFAKRLATARFETFLEHLPDTDDLLEAAGDGDEGEQEDDALAFAVFSSDGRLLLSDGDNGAQFIFRPEYNGFINTRLDDDDWRIVWLTSPDRRIIAAVGQELEYRQDMALEMLAGQMLPWLALLPVLLGGLAWMLSRELLPLRSVAANLACRDPDDLTPLVIGVQSEIRPLVQALNSLFARIDAMLSRERDFIANAAHELRTPLAGLSIQAQVAHNAKQPETRAHALSQLGKGINRASRLIDQLLLLFKLETLNHEYKKPQSQLGEMKPEPLKWAWLLETALTEAGEQIEVKGIRLEKRFEDQDGAGEIYGQQDLLGVMLRNIIGNAVKYTPESGRIEIVLERRSLTINNSSRDIQPSDAARLGERFFRPPGQNEAGSGLGLSIAKRAAELHGLTMSHRAVPGGFSVRIFWDTNKGRE